MHQRAFPKFDRAEYAAQTPEILILYVRTVTPTIDLHCQKVLTLLQVSGNIELGGRLSGSGDHLNFQVPSRYVIWGLLLWVEGLPNVT